MSKAKVSSESTLQGLLPAKFRNMFSEEISSLLRAEGSVSVNRHWGCGGTLPCRGNDMQKDPEEGGSVGGFRFCS